MLSPHFSTRLPPQPFKTPKHEALLNSQQNKKHNPKHKAPTNTTPNPNTQTKSKQPPSATPQPFKTPKHKAPPNSTKTPRQNKIKTTSFPHTSHPIPPPTLSPHFSTRLANQPFQTRNTQCTSQIPHQNPKYISKSKHLPIQHQTPKHKTKSEEPPLPHTSHPIPPPLCFHPISQPA